MVVRCLSEKIWNIQLYQRLFDISVCGKFVVNDNYLTSSDTLSKKSSFVIISRNWNEEVSRCLLAVRAKKGRISEF